MKSLILMIGVLITTTACASEVTVHGGWQHTVNSNKGDGATFDVRVEQPVWKGFSLGLEGGYHGETDNTSESGQSYGDLSGTHLLAELLYYPPVKWRVKPYIFGGWGWSWWSFDRSQSMQDAHIQIDMGDSFAEKYGFGADYAINENWSLNIEWSFFETDIPKDSYYQGEANHADGTFANVLGDDDGSGRVTTGHGETNLVVGLKYRF